jgi:hypothetical protein
MENFTETLVLTGVSPEDAFAYVSDVRNMPEWVDACVQNEPEGEAREGQEFNSLSSFMGLKLRGTQQVLAYEPTSHFAWGAEKPFHSRFDVTFSPQGADTELRIDAEMETKGIPGGAIVVKRSTKKAIAGMAQNLSKRLSAG